MSKSQQLMAEHVIDFRASPSRAQELPDLNFELSDTDQAIVRIARAAMEAQRLERNAKEGKTAGVK